MRCPRPPDLPPHSTRAVAQIETREHTEGLVPSQPRAHFGAAMERKLAELEAREQVTDGLVSGRLSA